MLEAAELLEVFQWSAGDVHCRDKMDRIREELADVLKALFVSLECILAACCEKSIQKGSFM